MEVEGGGKRTLLSSTKNAMIYAGFALTVRGAQSARSIRSYMVYACDTPVHELSELKARPDLWRLLHTAHLSPCQRESRAAFQPAPTATCIRVCLQSY